MSSCSDKIHCETWLLDHRHQWQWNELRWSSQWAENFHERMGQSKDSEWLSTEKDCLETQSSWSATFWRNLGKTGSKLQESDDCNLGQLSLHRRGTEHINVSYRANSQRKTPDSSKWRPWRLDGTHNKSFLATTRERECNLHAIQWTLLWPEKIFQKGSSICRLDLEKILVNSDCTREYLPQWNQRSKWSKEHVRNQKEDSLNHCYYKLGRIFEIFTGNCGVVRSARVKMAHGELNWLVVKLAPVFCDGVSEIENRASNVGATSNQLQRPSDSKK